MKKIFSVLITLLFLCCLGAEIQTASGDNKIQALRELIKSCPNQEFYDKLSGNNISKKPIIIEFARLSDYGDNYKNFDALAWKRKGQLYIYINDKHKDAPVEALASLIAGRIFNDDYIQSKNEEYYCWLSEAYMWTYLTKDKEIDNNENQLVKRETLITKLVNADSYTGKYLKKFVDLNKSYKDIAQQSPGFKNEEFTRKFDNLLKLYRGLKYD